MMSGKSLCLTLKRVCGTALLGLLVTASANAVDWNGYTVSVIRPGGDRTCTLFQLVGVSQSDATLAPGSPWFSIPNSAPEYKQMVAVLLLAKATDRTIDVTTSGVIPGACGQPSISVLVMH